jgi:hypothetical protein
MFKLSVEFETIKELSEFVQKMGGDVISSDITVESATPSKGKGKGKGKTAAQVEEVAEVKVDPFLGEQAPAATQPTVQQEQPVASAPVVNEAPVTQAAPVVQINRAQYNEASIALVQKLKAAQLPDESLVQLMQSTFAYAGCPAGSKITTITDAQMLSFYSIFERNANQALSAIPKAQGPGQNFI